MGEPTRKRGVLLLTFTFPPDVGGVETHLADLVREVRRRSAWRLSVCTYKPIVTNLRDYRARETDDNVDIRRWWWFGGSCGGNLFRRFEPRPVLLFLYITPYYLLRTFFFLLAHRAGIDVINVHGLNMAFVGAVLGPLFGKPTVMQTHALYNFQPDSLFARVARWALRRTSLVLTQSTASRNELLALGIPPEKLAPYRHWIDLTAYATGDKSVAKQQLGWPAGFTVLFVARLIDIKGPGVVCALAERFPQVRFVIAGDGPERPRVEAAAARLPNLRYAGLVANAALPQYYRAAELTLLASQYPEGIPKVICESLACGTPVIASNLGGTVDAMDDTVGILCPPDVDNLATALARLTGDAARYDRCRANARPYAERHYSQANAERIISAWCRAAGDDSRPTIEPETR